MAKIREVFYNGQWMPVSEASRITGLSGALINSRCRNANPSTAKGWAMVFEEVKTPSEYAKSIQVYTICPKLYRSFMDVFERKHETGLL